ncbi:type ISP restriction/modification enzyme [uncultured Streptomyces sp.]|uniref:type ISP restriction/modification enzyme n=1 Tax=uncultured Streptomyces sp. TaxID=174707 RepID=UPI00260E7AC8|nr:type ISP restriction/modification enzyme [uncultured Streptomyces sp.]
MVARKASGADGERGFTALGELMPWSVRPLRTGRSWVLGPDPATLRARWERLAAAGDDEERDRLFRPSRSRTPRTPVAALPGQSSGTSGFAREPGACPAPVRVLHGPFDEQWLLPDHRLIDAARPELWRVADARQLFTVEHGSGGPGAVPDPMSALSVTPLLPDGHSPAGRPGRIRPLYRRPGGTEPNLAPGLLALLDGVLAPPDGYAVTPETFLAWTVAAVRPSPGGCVVPLPAVPDLWLRGVDLGRELLRLRLRGARGGDRPRLPGGRRPYVRAALPPRPTGVAYDAASQTLSVGAGRVSPVPEGAWTFEAAGVRVLELWLRRRGVTADGGEPAPAPRTPDGLDAVVPRAWPQEWTSELLELITVLALLDAARPAQAALHARIDASPTLGPARLRAAGVLPAPASSRRPASVLGHQEEGPEGQFALL